MRKISVAVLLVPALAWAQPKTADGWYEEGSNQYNLGNFDRAIDAFKQGFALEADESRKANYLYNVAQSYRQLHDCKNALFFYKRYLALKSNDTVKPIPPKKRREVEGFINELDACVRQQAQVSEKPPTTLPADGEAPDKGRPPGITPSRKEPDKAIASSAGGEPADSDQEDEASVSASEIAVQPHVISVRLIGGGSKVNLADFEVPVQATFALSGGYPIPLDRWTTLEVGAALTFTPVPYEGAAGSKTGQLWGVMANAGLTYEVMPKLSVRGDAGLGALVFAGVSESVFTANKPTTGALTMFHLRAAVSGEYEITPNVVVTLTPVALTYSPAKSGLVEKDMKTDVKSISSVDFAMVGIGYRM